MMFKYCREHHIMTNSSKGSTGMHLAKSKLETDLENNLSVFSRYYFQPDIFRLSKMAKTKKS